MPDSGRSGYSGVPEHASKLRRMAMTVKYDGEELPIDSEQAQQLLDAFETGASGVIPLTPERGYGTLYVAYGPGIPVVFDGTDD